MKRRLLNFLTVLSLLLCVAVAVLWVRSYWMADAWGWARESAAVHAGADSGRLRVGWTVLAPGSTFAPSKTMHISWRLGVDPPAITLPTTVSILGFAVHRNKLPSGFDSAILLLPFWFVAGVASLPPAVLLRAARRRREREQQMRNHLCSRCGYDLRATPGRCPECGNAPEGAAL
jgi:hypothetical protein